MTKIVKHRRYPENIILSTTGADGELIIDTTNKTLTVHDGVTAGGSKLVAKRELAATTAAGLIGSIPTDTLVATNIQAALVELDAKKATTSEMTTITSALIESRLATKANIVDLAATSGAASIGFTPTGTINSATVQAAIVELNSEKINTTDLSVLSGATKIGFTPTGTIAATTVQTAIAEINSDLAATGGAALVGFTSTGTGAVACTVDAKLRETVSVFDFMTPAQITDAQGTTSTGSDHYAAFQNALNYVGGLRGGDVLVPPGSYLLSSMLTFPLKNGVSLIGQGECSQSSNTYPCVLNFTHIGSAAVRIMTSGQSIENLVIQATGSRAGAALDTVSFGILVDGLDTSNGSPANWSLKNVFITNHPSHGFVSSGPCFMPSIDGICTRGNKGHGIFISDGTATGRTNKGRPGGFTIKHIRNYINGGHDIVVTPLPETNAAYRMYFLDGDLSSRGVTQPDIPASIKIANACCVFHVENLTAIDLAFDGYGNTGVATYAGVHAAGMSHRYITCRYVSVVGLMSTEVASLGLTDDICIDGPYITNDSNVTPAVIIGSGVGAITIISRNGSGGGSLRISTPFTTGYTGGVFIGKSVVQAPSFISAGTVTGTQFSSTPTGSVGFTTSRDSAEIGIEVIRTGTGAATGQLRAAASNIQIGSTSANNVDIIRGGNAVATFTDTGFTSTGTVTGTYVTSTPTGFVGFTTSRDSATIGIEVIRTGIGAATGQLRASGSNIQIGSTSANNVDIIRGGNVVATFSSTDTTLSLSPQITGGTSAYGILLTGETQADVTSAAYYLRVNTTVAASATIANVIAYNATKGTFGAGSTVTTQTGFNVTSALTGATNNFGFRGSLASATGVYNLYMDGTAANYLAGKLSIGTATAGTGTILDVQSTTGGLRFPNMTTTQKAAITPAVGTVVFDTTLNKLGVYQSSAWKTLADKEELALSTGATLVGTIQSGTGAVARTVDAKLKETLSVKDFGATGNGVTDDTAAINATIAAAALTGGGTVFFPPGRYIVSSTIIVNHSNIYLLGGNRSLQNIGGTIIMSNAPTGDIIHFGSSIANLRFNGISNLTVTVVTGVTKTSGAGINIERCGFFNASQLALFFQFVGIFINSPNQTTTGVSVILSDIYIGNTIPVTGIGVLVDYVTDLWMDKVVQNTLVSPSAHPAHGFKINHTTSIYAHQCEVLHHLNGLTLNPGDYVGADLSDLNKVITFCFFNQCLFDYCSVIGIEIFANVTGSMVRGIYFMNCWTSSSGNGVLIHKDPAALTSSIQGITFSNHIALNNDFHGISFSEAVDVNILGGAFTGNSKLSLNNYDGINVGANTSSFKINNIMSGTNTGYAVVQQRYGINVEAGASDHYTITDNSLFGNYYTVGIFDGGSGTNKIVEQNLADSYGTNLNTLKDAQTAIAAIDAKTVFPANIVIGGIKNSSINLYIPALVTGGTTAHGFLLNGPVQNDVTATAYYVKASNTLAASTAITNLFSFQANQGTFGAGSTVTTQTGFAASSALAGATNNFGFRGSLAAATGSYNLYMDGTADNYLGGRLGLGGAVNATAKLAMPGTITGGATAYSIYTTGAVQSDVTSAAYYNRVNNAVALSVTVGTVASYMAAQGTFGAGSNVTTQIGFSAASTLVGATNNYGFRGSLASATGVYNLYMDGTAANYLAGKLSIGTTTSGAGAILDVQSTVGGVRFPNMTTTQKNAISTPSDGVTVFDTTLKKLCTYQNSTWKTIGGDCISVKDFGATGDGVTDDTTAIQNAVTAAAGATVFFPAGTYITSATITCLYSGATILGDTAGITRVYGTHTTGAIFRFYRSFSGIRNIEINSYILGASDRRASTANNGFGVQFECEDVVDNTNTRMRCCFCTNVAILNQPGSGFYFVGPATQGGIVSGCYSNGNRGHGFAGDRGQLSGRVNLASTGGCMTIDTSLFYSNQGNGIAVGTPTDTLSSPAVRLLITNCEVNGNATNTVTRYSNSQMYIDGANHLITTCVFDTGGTTGGVYATGRNIWVVNNRFLECTYAVTVGYNVKLQSQGVNVEGMTVINTATGSMNPAVIIEAGAINTRVVNNTNSFITSLVTPHAPGTQLDTIPQTIIQATDQQVSNTTLTNTDLKYYLTSGVKYHFEAIIEFTSDSVADIKVTFTVPTFSQIRWSPINGIKVDAAGTIVPQAQTTVSGDPVTFGYIGAGNRQQIAISGYVYCGATSILDGFLQLQIAQNATSVATPVTIREGASRLTVTIYKP